MLRKAAAQTRDTLRGRSLCKAILEAIAASGIGEVAIEMIDSTVVQAHQQRPWLRATFVAVQVSSVNTSFLESRSR